MDKANEIKRRAQRFVQNGDLDSAVAEFQKLAALETHEPYHLVVIADLLYKKGDNTGAGQNYLVAVDGYDKAGLYKNAIAVCKKMARLNLAPGPVFLKLAELHQHDGFGTESALYYLQHAEWALRSGSPEQSATSFRLAYDAAPDNVQALERLADVQGTQGETAAFVATLREAAAQYERMGLLAEAQRCRDKFAKHAAEFPEGAENGAAAAAAPAGSAPAASAPAAGVPVSAAPNGAAPQPASPASAPNGAPARAPQPVHPASPPASASARVAAGPVAPAAPAIPVPARDPRVPPSSAPRPSGVAPAPARPPAAPAGPVAPATPAATPSARATSPAPAPSRVTPPVAAPADDDRLVIEDSSPVPFSSRPGLRFDGGGGASAGDFPFWDLAEDAVDFPEIAQILEQSADRHRAGSIEDTAMLLVRAAQAHDHYGNVDSAARVYRAMRDHLPPVATALLAWFEGCRQRGATIEASTVAVELGKEALLRSDKAAARDWFERAFVLDPNNSTAAARLDEVTTGSNPITRVSPRPGANGGAEAEALGTVSTATDKIEITVGARDEKDVHIRELVGAFQREVEDQVSGDAQSHYALGVTYLEMGLIDQAVESLRLAGRDPSLRHSAGELIARCFMDRGRFEDAAMELGRALEHSTGGAESTTSLRFELGLALEAAGRPDEALAEFERVYDAQPSYPDAAMKIRTLRGALGRG